VVIEGSGRMTGGWAGRLSTWAQHVLGSAGLADKVAVRCVIKHRKEMCGGCRGGVVSVGGEGGGNALQASIHHARRRDVIEEVCRLCGGERGGGGGRGCAQHFADVNITCPLPPPLLSATCPIHTNIILLHPQPLDDAFHSRQEDGPDGLYWVGSVDERESSWET
jgi:hypothetical protein